jgi:hypothetical protein
LPWNEWREGGRVAHGEVSTSARAGLSSGNGGTSGWPTATSFFFGNDGYVLAFHMMR